MVFLASMLAYFGFVTGIAVALLMTMTAFLATPDHPTIALPAVAMARKPSVSAATTNATTTLTSRIGQQNQHGAPGIWKGLPVSQIKSAGYARRRVQMANKTARKQFLHMLARQERMRHWASQQGPDFESRFMGYVDDPSADRSLVQ
jgi:hypothetical protein